MSFRPNRIESYRKLFFFRPAKCKSFIRSAGCFAVSCSNYFYIFRSRGSQNLQFGVATMSVKINAQLRVFSRPFLGGMSCQSSANALPASSRDSENQWGRGGAADIC